MIDLEATQPGSDGSTLPVDGIDQDLQQCISYCIEHKAMQDVPLILLTQVIRELQRLREALACQP